MPRTPIILWDDGRGRFGPLTDLRSALELRTGTETTLGRHLAHWGERIVGVRVPEAVAGLVAERSSTPVNAKPDVARLVVVCGRVALPEELDPFAFPRAGGEGIAEGEAVVTNGEMGETLLCANLAREEAIALFATNELPSTVRRRTVEAPRSLLARPWHLFDAIEPSIRHDLAAGRFHSAVDVPTGTTVIRGEPIVVDPTARICPGATVDSEHGPVIVQAGALVRPGAILIGPCVIGENSVVAEHATIRARTVIGPRCKVGGEISATIFLGSSNKVHDGFLGDTVVGEWVNLGAGTVGSNLLNTYGETTMRQTPDGPRERTGRQFLGAVIGDHVKTAIGTRLMTATSIGVGAMIAASTPPPTTVAPFAWITDEGTRSYRIDKFLEAMARVMSRRGDTPSAALVEAITALHGRGA